MSGAMPTTESSIGAEGNVARKLSFWLALFGMEMLALVGCLIVLAVVDFEWDLLLNIALFTWFGLYLIQLARRRPLTRADLTPAISMGVLLAVGFTALLFLLSFVLWVEPEQQRTYLIILLAALVYLPLLRISWLAYKHLQEN